jgi:hypothetical protein
MRYDNEHGIQELYNIAAKAPYQEHKFSTIRRGFAIDPMLVKPKSEFRLDNTWCEHPESNRDALRGGF